MSQQEKKTTQDSGSQPFLHILPFYRTRLPDLPPIHSVVLIYWKYEINELLQFTMIYKNLHWL